MIPLNEFRPTSKLVLEEHPVTKPRFRLIDAHNHLRVTRDVDGLLRAMDEFGIGMIVNLDGAPGEMGEYQLKRFVEPHPDRFTVFVQVDASRVDEPDFAAEARKRIEDYVAHGAAGIKFHKTLGLTIRDSKGVIIMPDDRRLKPIWEQAARLDIPVTIHIGDPLAFFEPIDNTNERYEELAEHPDWSFATPQFCRYEELLEAQHNLLRDNPDTRFIVAHVGSLSEDLKRAGEMLDLYPNMYVDTAERIAELGRQPYSARTFLLRYQDRVLYGTDLLPNRSNVMGNYRFFETFDEYFPYNSWDEHNQGRWNIYGVGLPDEVLEKIYCKNALRVIPRLQRYF